jgi:hypothetical protein
VIDKKIDQAAETGFFEQIFKQVIPKTPAYMGKHVSDKFLATSQTFLCSFRSKLVT